MVAGQQPTLTSMDVMPAPRLQLGHEPKHAGREVRVSSAHEVDSKGLPTTLLTSGEGHHPFHMDSDVNSRRTHQVRNDAHGMR